MNDYFSYTPVVASYLIATQIYFYLHEEYIVVSFFFQFYYCFSHF